MSDLGKLSDGGNKFEHSLDLGTGTQKFKLRIGENEGKKVISLVHLNGETSEHSVLDLTLDPEASLELGIKTIMALGTELSACASKEAMEQQIDQLLEGGDHVRIRIEDGSSPDNNKKARRGLLGKNWELDDFIGTLTKGSKKNQISIFVFEVASRGPGQEPVLTSKNHLSKTFNLQTGEVSTWSEHNPNGPELFKNGAVIDGAFVKNRADNLKNQALLTHHIACKALEHLAQNCYYELPKDPLDITIKRDGATDNIEVNKTSGSDETIQATKVNPQDKASSDLLNILGGPISSTTDSESESTDIHPIVQIEEIALQLGFSEPQHLYDELKTKWGQPGEGEVLAKLRKHLALPAEHNFGVNDAEGIITAAKKRVEELNQKITSYSTQKAPNSKTLTRLETLQQKREEAMQEYRRLAYPDYRSLDQKGKALGTGHDLNYIENIQNRPGLLQDAYLKVCYITNTINKLVKEKHPESNLRLSHPPKHHSFASPEEIISNIKTPFLKPLTKEEKVLAQAKEILGKCYTEKENFESNHPLSDPDGSPDQVRARARKNLERQMNTLFDILKIPKVKRQGYTLEDLDALIKDREDSLIKRRTAPKPAPTTFAGKVAAKIAAPFEKRKKDRLEKSLTKETSLLEQIDTPYKACCKFFKNERAPTEDEKQQFVHDYNTLMQHPLLKKSKLSALKFWGKDNVPSQITKDDVDDEKRREELYYLFKDSALFSTRLKEQKDKLKALTQSKTFDAVSCFIPPSFHERLTAKVANTLSNRGINKFLHEKQQLDDFILNFKDCLQLLNSDSKQDKKDFVQAYKGLLKSPTLKKNFLLVLLRFDVALPTIESVDDIDQYKNDLKGIFADEGPIMKGLTKQRHKFNKRLKKLYSHVSKLQEQPFETSYSFKSTKKDAINWGAWIDRDIQNAGTMTQQIKDIQLLKQKKEHTRGFILNLQKEEFVQFMLNEAIQNAEALTTYNTGNLPQSESLQELENGLRELHSCLTDPKEKQAKTLEELKEKLDNLDKGEDSFESKLAAKMHDMVTILQ